MKLLGYRSPLDGSVLIAIFTRSLVCLVSFANLLINGRLVVDEFRVFFAVLQSSETPSAVNSTTDSENNLPEYSSKEFKKSCGELTYLVSN